jgi:hypothetical protein
MKPMDPTTSVVVQLVFDSYFVPKMLGLSDDSRALVVGAPTEVRLLPATGRSSRGLLRSFNTGEIGSLESEGRMP